MGFSNAYKDVLRAKAYAKLKFSGTYYLEYRDLTDIIGKTVRGLEALDFDFGTGRSSVF
jgi:hypothetical protein